MKRKVPPGWVAFGAIVLAGGSALLQFAGRFGFGTAPTAGIIAGLLVVAADVGYTTWKRRRHAVVSLGGLTLGVLIGLFVGSFTWAETLRHDLDRARLYDFVVISNDDPDHRNAPYAVEFITRGGEPAAGLGHAVGTHVHVVCRIPRGQYEVADGNLMDAYVLKAAPDDVKAQPPACPDS